jgi:hypothetical protein
MMILGKLLQGGARHAAWGWHTFGRGDQAVRDTEAWQHETFAEEQARWERNDPAYARICERVRQAKKTGGEPSRRADQAKAEWDARAAMQRQADDDAQRAHHASKADHTATRRPATSRTSSERRKTRSLNSIRTPRLAIRAREGHHQMHTTFAIESNYSPAPGIMPEPVHVHDQPARPARRAGHPPLGRATKPLASPSQRSVVPAKLMRAVRGDKHMTDACPPAYRQTGATRRDGDGSVRPSHDGPLRAGARSPAPPEPREAEHCVLAETRTNKR